MMKKQNILYPFFIFILFLSCQNFMGGMPNNQDDDQSYMPLNVGDVRQIIMVEDSSTLLMSVVGTTYRSDGTRVYCMESKWGNFIPDTTYYVNRDGYFSVTGLDTTTATDIDIAINPFCEERLAKLYPEDSEIFIQIPGTSHEVFWMCRKEDSLKTFCGIFTEVFSFTLYDNLATIPIRKTFYGRGYGYLGIASFYSIEPYLIVSFIRVGDKTVGTMWPVKNPRGLRKSSEDKHNLSTILNRIFYPGLDPLGRRLK